MASEAEWEAYHKKIDDTLKKYDRVLHKSDAKSCYVGLVEEGLSEEIAYEANKLSEELHFSACEMRFNYNGKKKLTGITLEDFKEIRNIFPEGYIDLPYYSNPTSKMLYDVIQFCKKKKEEFDTNGMDTYSAESKYSFYDHVDRSCGKELYCYRAFKDSELDTLSDT